jgi:hypothetical protein
MRYVFIILAKKPETKRPFGDLVMNGRTKLKMVKFDVDIWTGFNRLRAGSDDGLLGIWYSVLCCTQY